MIGNFPRTTVAGISLPRLIIGTNWMLGYSHRGNAADIGIRRRFQTAEDFVPVLTAFLKHGINALMAPASSSDELVRAIRLAEERAGQKIIIIDTPAINVDDSAPARAAAAAAIKKSAEIGSTFCLIHHASCEQLVDKNKKTIRRIDDYTNMVRAEGMLPGLSAHAPEIVVYSDLNGYDVETYIQIYNCLGFLMQVEAEYIQNVIHSAKKPVITIKPLAAGRTTPFIGLNFCYNTIRECDMVTIGASDAGEAEEDIEFARAAIERRRPNVVGRGSPVPQAAHVGRA